jgi:hypothetical protein
MNQIMNAELRRRRYIYESLRCGARGAVRELAWARQGLSEPIVNYGVIPYVGSRAHWVR